MRDRLIYPGHIERKTVLWVEAPMPRVNVRGFDVYYETYGRGEPLVLLHNGLGSTKSFSQQIGKFSKRLRVISYDRAGYGRSADVLTPKRDWLDESVDELESFLDQLHVEKAHLCGICVGGAIGLLFAARNPQRAGNIVVAGTCCYGEEETTSRVLRLYPTPENLPAEWLRELADHHGETHGRDLYRVFYQAIREENGYPFKGYDLRPSLPSVKSPVLIIYGDRDSLFNLEQGLTMYRCLDKSELCVIPDCGHLPNEERPQQFNMEVLDFIRRHQDQQLGKTQWSQVRNNSGRWHEANA